MALSLSICIPTFNRAALLRETLLRLEQTHPCFDEIVVSDNASTDDTPSVVAALRPRFRTLTYFRHPSNRGPLRNFQAALSLGASDLLFALSDDDALLPDGITAAVALLASDPDAVAVYGGYEKSLDNLASSCYRASPLRTGRFTRAEAGLLAQTGNLLSFPVVRRTVFQRHCFFDDTTFGLLRLVAQLVQQGPVHVVEYPIYRHRDETPGAMEAHGSEPWYLDSNRSDWEIFTGMLGSGDFDLTAQLVAGGSVPLYHLANDIERARNRPLHERSFLIRYLAYMARRDPADAARKIADWEKTRLIAATMERLRERIAICAGLTRVVIEQGRLNIAAMWQGIAEGFPDVDSLPLEPEAFAAFARRPGDFLVAETWDSLERRGEVRPTDGIAVRDLIASLRLPGSTRTPLLFGPSGTPHFSTDLEAPTP